MDANKSNSTEASTHEAIHQFNHNLKPEWLRIPEAVHVSGISRSGLYAMIAAGTIPSMCLRKRGAARGIRLISYDGLCAAIERAASQGGIIE